MQAKIIRSLSIDNFIHSEYKNYPSNIDMVVSVGGFYGFYMIGMDKILKKLEKEKKINIKRYSGSSVGAICSVLMACNISAHDTINIYNNLMYSKNYFEKLKSELLRLLPKDAFLLCNDRVFIHITQIGFPFILNHIVISKFNDNQDLVDAMMASSNMPLFISPKLTYKFRGKHCIDGCFSTLLPIFKDNLYDQLLIKLYKIKYYQPYVYRPIDSSIEGLIVKGAVETDKFFSGKHHDIITLSWHSNKIKKSKLKLKNYFYTLFLFLTYRYIIKSIIFKSSNLNI